MKINPFEAHPESSPPQKKPNNILTLEQIRDIISNRIIEVGTEQEPKWGWDRHSICALLNNIMIELEEECHNN